MFSQVIHNVYLEVTCRCVGDEIFSGLHVCEQTAERMFRLMPFSSSDTCTFVHIAIPYLKLTYLERQNVAEGCLLSFLGDILQVLFHRC